MKYINRNKKFLTKSEYAKYLETMKQHAVDTLAEDFYQFQIKDEIKEARQW